MLGLDFCRDCTGLESFWGGGGDGVGGGGGVGSGGGDC